MRMKAKWQPFVLCCDVVLSYSLRKRGGGGVFFVINSGQPSKYKTLIVPHGKKKLVGSFFNGVILCQYFRILANCCCKSRERESFVLCSGKFHQISTVLDNTNLDQSLNSKNIIGGFPGTSRFSTTVLGRDSEFNYGSVYMDAASDEIEVKCLE